MVGRKYILVRPKFQPFCLLHTFSMEQFPILLILSLQHVKVESTLQCGDRGIQCVSETTYRSCWYVLWWVEYGSEYFSCSAGDICEQEIGSLEQVIEQLSQDLSHFWGFSCIDSNSTSSEYSTSYNVSGCVKMEWFRYYHNQYNCCNHHHHHHNRFYQCYNHHNCNSNDTCKLVQI